jgi:vitamin B12 transporter
MRHLLAVSFIFLTAASAAFAQQNPTSVRLSDEIIVTASALPERVEETPAAVTVITREDIDRRAARDVSDVLREVPGLHLARIGSAGHQTSLFMRGSNPAHTLVLWNGIEINSPVFGGYDWGQFSTAGVQQIEVVRGPYSALYGSDAMAGVINILTAPSESGVSALVEAGGNGFRTGQVSVAQVSGRTTLSASLESRNDDGFAVNDDFSQETANVALRWSGASGTSLGVIGRYATFELGVPTNLNAFADALIASPRRRQDGSERQIAIPFEQVLGRFRYEVLLAETRREDSFTDPDDPWGLLFQNTDSRSRRARLTTRTATRFGTIVAGAETESSVVNDITSFGPNFVDGKRRERSLFVEDRYSKTIGSRSRLELSAGVRYDDYETFGSETSPRLAAAWSRGTNKFRLAYGEAFRAPSVGEMFSPWGGNPDLRAERSRNIEAGVDHYFNDGIVSLTLFRDRYRDLITNAGFVLANVGRARSEGVELSARGAVSQRIDAGFSYTWLDTEQLDSGLPLLRRPRHSGSAFVSVRQGISQWSLVLLRTGVRDDILPVLPFSRLTHEAHSTVAANVQFDIGRFTPYVKIENLTNTSYEEVRGYPSPARRAIAGVRFAM